MSHPGVARPPADGDVAQQRGSTALLSVQELSIHFRTKRGFVYAVDGVSLDIGAGETVGLVGETGSGKSVTARSILRLVPMPPGVLAGGRIYFRPRDADASSEPIDLLRTSDSRLRAIRGNRIAMIFQDPAKALNPAMTIRDQLAEVFAEHRAPEVLAGAGLSGGNGAGALLQRAAHGRSGYVERRLLSLPPLRHLRKRIDAAVDERIGQALEDTHIANPRKIMASYPHELSGGMKQRVMIAQALACNPDLLIADEPTTALDVTIQARILELIRELQERRGTAVLYISHDLSLVRQISDRVAVMYAGQLVETGPVRRIFEEPLHPYTRGLLEAIPSPGQPRGKLAAIEGTVPEVLDPDPGCRFSTRCPHAAAACRRLDPPLRAHRGSPDHGAACFLYEDAAEVGVQRDEMPGDA